VPPEDEQTTGKPYRVYRGGRVKGRVPLERSDQAAPAGGGRPPTKDGKGGYKGPGPVTKHRRFRPNLRGSSFWLRLAGSAFLVVFLFAIVWAVLAYFAVRGGINDAHKRLPKTTKTQLAHQGGLLLFHGTTILYLGLDHSRLTSRAEDRHSDTILLIRTDPDHHRLAYLSIPRDLKVAVPGYGQQKINAAYQIGGAPLALATIHEFTSLPVNHILIADFNDFRKVIDELGGIDVYVPEKILSNRFDCPYSSVERCHQWKGWRYAKGWQHMNGWRALIYSRIRENQLDPTESDLTRGERQQAVLQATLHKLTTVHTFLRLPFMGGDVFRPLATDLSAGQVLQLGWNFKRANPNRTLHCRLGGTGYDDPTLGSVILSSEENFGVIHMFTGDSAPQPPLPGSGPYGPGCVVGQALFKR
jgi:polyisoprenyl-teichoic acid--peptidoglycan teichoic acid transferase